MGDVADVTVKATADTSEAKKGIDDLGTSASKSGGFFKDAAGSFVGFITGLGVVGIATTAFGFLSDTIKESVSAASEDQNVQAQLSAALKSTHDSSGLTASGLEDLAEKLSLTTTFSKDTTLQAEEMGLRFTNIGSTVFPQVVEMAQNLSARMGTGLTQAMTLVGRAVDDPTKGLTALTRIGVTFTAQQTEQIKSLVASGDTMKAQGIILDALNTKFGGAAAAAGGTFAGQLTILQNSFEELKVKIGDAVIPILTQLLSDATPLLNLFGSLLPPVLGKVSTLLAGLSPIITNVFSVITPAITGFVNTLTGVGPGSDDVKGKIGGLTATLGQMIGPVSGVGNAFTNQVIPAFKTVLPSIISTGQSLTSILLPAFGIVVSMVRDVVPPVFNLLMTILKNLFPLIQTVAQILATQLFPALQSMVPVVEPIITELGKWIDQLLNVLVPIIQVLLPVAIGILVVAFNLVLTVVKAVWPAISATIQTAINIITDIFNIFKDVFTGNWSNLWNDVLKLLIDIGVGIITIITNLVGGILGLFGGLFGGLLGIVGNGIGAVLGWFGSLATSLNNKITEIKLDLVNGALDWMKGIAEAVLNGLGNIIGAFEKLASDIINVFRNLVSQVASLMNSIPGIGGLIGKIPGFATGTTYAPGGPAIVGEGQEPELVVGPHFGILGAGTGVYPISQLAVSGGGGGFGNQLIVLQLDSQVLTRTTIKGTPKQVYIMTGIRGTH